MILPSPVSACVVGLVGVVGVVGVESVGGEYPSRNSAGSSESGCGWDKWNKIASIYPGSEASVGNDNARKYHSPFTSRPVILPSRLFAFSNIFRRRASLRASASSFSFELSIVCVVFNSNTQYSCVFRFWFYLWEFKWYLLYWQIPICCVKLKCQNVTMLSSARWTRNCA